ncbi:MAG TPA: amidohydrolase family protein [Candidatus Methylomirabilis sp.]|nr:amidohydrolase family protein [Candidatus Methylomirabilis sp.]
MLERIIDVQAFDVPLSRKLPALFRHLTEGLPASDPRRGQAETAKLPDLIEDMDRAGVGVSLVVLREETGEFSRLAAGHPGRLFGLAYFDSLAPREGLERVSALCHEHPDLILGVSTAMSIFGQDPRLRDFIPLYELCLERDLPVQFQVGGDPGEAGSRPMALGVLAAAYPRLRIVCAHPAGAWHEELPRVLRQSPNLFLALDGREGRDRRADGAPLTIRELVRRAGSRKLMFGSRRMGREATFFDAAEGVRSLPWWQRRNVCWRTAARVYGTRILETPTTHTGTFPSTR